MARKYELRQRAESQAQTQRRIIEATVRLHNTVGPARTTIGAIAELAGVERLTVYRHFPDKTELFRACAAHHLAVNAPPDVREWTEIRNPTQRLRAGLLASYAYYRKNEPGMAVILRDREAGLPVGLGFIQYQAAARDAIAPAWPRARRVRAVIAHALDFQVWRSLAVRERLADADVAELMIELVRAAARQTRPRARPRQA